MSPNKRNTPIDKGHKPQSTREPIDDRKEVNKAAHDQAEKDMEQDADLSIHSPNDDLDEAEAARLGEDKTDLV